MVSSIAKVWFSLEAQFSQLIKSQLFSANALLKSLLLVIAFKEKCLEKVVRSYLEPWGNFQEIQICLISLFHTSRRLMHSFYILLRQSRQTQKDKLKTILRIQ